MKTLFFISFLSFVISCKKSESKKACPVQTYKIECTTSAWDSFLGRYDTGTQQGTIQANCPEDAQKMATDMSYGFGQTYKHCKIIP